MRNSVLILVVLGCFIVTGCGGIKEYSLSEQICLDNSGTLADDNYGNKACIFSDGKDCPLAAIEDGDCFLIDDSTGDFQNEIGLDEEYSCSKCDIEEDIDFQSLEEKAVNIGKILGGLSPEDALEYMKNTKDLVLIDVRDLEKKPNGFVGSLEIPYNQLVKRIEEIPQGRPVLLYCGGGNVAPKGYQALLEFNPEIPELGYIAGTPLFDEYNAWAR